MITIINYGLGNLNSIANMLKKVGVSTTITSDIQEIEKAEKLILPGVGSFDEAMKNLKMSDIIAVLKERVLGQKIPLLGICLGMQLLTLRSEEGNIPGLGWVDAETIKFDNKKTSEKLRLPHMGWNSAMIRKKNDLFCPIHEEQRFYFLHSYHVVCGNQDDVLCTTEYGYPFVSAFQKGNILGVQFHPEKSHRYGMQFMRKFARS